MWVRSTESSRCSRPLNMIYRESEFLFPSVGSAWIKNRLGAKTSCCASIASNQNNADSNHSLSGVTSPSSEMNRLDFFTVLFLFHHLPVTKNVSWIESPHTSFPLLLCRLLEHHQVSVMAEGSRWAVKNTASRTCCAWWVTAAPQPYEQISPVRYKTKPCLKSLFWQITEHIEEKRSCRKHGSTLIDLKYGCFLRTLPEPCYA